ncbi:MAG: hypothetical protein U0263_18450 [Polyangiaceae bacterium]
MLLGTLAVGMIVGTPDGIRIRSMRHRCDESSAESGGGVLLH